MEGKPFEISLDTARRLAIAKQHLSGKLPKSPGPATIMSLLRDIRYLQIDPTATVAPSHQLVLWSRLGRFRESDLESLRWREKKLFENWAHMASIVLTEDYPLYVPRMRKFAKDDKVWGRRLRQWMKDNADLRRAVLEQLRARGPQSSRDFQDGSRTRWMRARREWGLKESAWSSQGDISTMLEFMFHEGTVLVAGRQGRQKLWDLTERFLPDWTPKEELPNEEVERTGAQLSLKALGVATPKQVAFHFLIWRYPNIKKTMGQLESEGKVVPVSLGAKPSLEGRWYIHPDDLRLAQEIARGEWEPRTTLLSPFDNLIIDRDRTHALFDYFFRIEIYTPKKLRTHGFFVMSILDGDRIVGRLDPVMDREKERLVINAVHAERSATGGRAQARRIASAIDDLASFLGAKRVDYPRAVPDQWRPYLR